MPPLMMRSVVFCCTAFSSANRGSGRFPAHDPFLRRIRDLLLDKDCHAVQERRQKARSDLEVVAHGLVVPPWLGSRLGFHQVLTCAAEARVEGRHHTGFVQASHGIEDVLGILGHHEI